MNSKVARNGSLSNGTKANGPAAPAKKVAIFNNGPSFEQIKAQCLKSGRLYEDPNFPADTRSIGDPEKNYAWKRPGVSVQLTNYLIPTTPKRRLGSPPTDVSAAMTDHRPGLSIDWC